MNAWAMEKQRNLKPSFKSRAPTDLLGFQWQTHGGIREKLAHHLCNYFSKGAVNALCSDSLIFIS